MYLQEEISWLHSCSLCPRKCKSDRFSDKLGYCNSGAGFEIASICVHKGEEPVISGGKGICNVFFPHCNLQCVYCQNYDISGNTCKVTYDQVSFEEVIRRIRSVLEKTENIVGFVSPSHYIPQMMAIMRGLTDSGAKPVFVYNSNGYDRVETLRMFEGKIDVYLPDFKYLDPEIAYNYSNAKNYPEIASQAIKEMFRQKGATLIVNNNGIAESGIIIRHLVLPNASQQSVRILKYIAEEISVKVHISLLAQYFPTNLAHRFSLLDRTITLEEYAMVVKAFHEIGFYRGWIQELESQAVFRPDFSDALPFGN